MVRKKKQGCRHNSEQISKVWHEALCGDDRELTKQVNRQVDERKDEISTISVDMSTIDETKKDLLLRCPTFSVDSIKNTMKEKGFEDSFVIVEKFTDSNLGASKKRIREFRAEDIGKVVVFEGLIRTSTPINPKLKMIALSCRECGAYTYILQEGDEKKCNTGIKCGGGGVSNSGCGKMLEPSSEDSDASVFINFMQCQIEEEPEGLRGRQPERMLCEMVGPLTTEEKRVGIGDRGILFGIYKAREMKGENLVYQGYVEVLGIKKKGKHYEELVVSPEDEKKFIEMSKDPTLLIKMAGAVAPNISGHDIVKSAIILQMVGGNLHSLDRRGDIHILIIGDPGIGKSKMVRNFVEVAPHAIKASGAPTTMVGLTACVKKDEDSPGGFVLEAGAAVLADGGLLVIDEFDKMDKETRGALHEIMEDQKTTVSKANINTELSTRCSVLAIMNPKRNRFNTDEVVSDQIDLPHSLISRFDLVFALRDEVDEIKDRKICEAILRARDTVEVKKEYTNEEVTKYLIYVRSKIREMKISIEAGKILTDKFISIRTSNKDGIIPITLRSMEGLSRLSEACAKLRLSNVVEAQDAEKAIGILEYYLNTMCLDPGTGKVTVDKVLGGELPAEQKRRVGLKAYIEDHYDEISDPKTGWIPIDRLMEVAEKEMGMSEKDFNATMVKMKDIDGLFVHKDAERKIEINKSKFRLKQRTSELCDFEER